MPNEIELAEFKAREKIHDAEQKASDIIRQAEEKARVISDSMKSVGEFPSNKILEVKLDYMQKDIGTIKNDVKEIKADFVPRREFTEKVKDLSEDLEKAIQGVKDRYDLPMKIIYGLCGLILVGFVGAAVNFFINR